LLTLKPCKPMQTIRITPDANNANTAPNAGATQTPDQGKTGPGTSPEGAKMTITDEAALKGTEHTKISTLQPLHSAGQSALPAGQSVAVGGMVDGKLAVELIDALLPALFVVLIQKVGLTMKKTDLQMTAKEKETVAPILQQCMNQLMINFNNPWAALGVTLGVIYGGKILEKGGPAFLEKKAEKAKAATENKKAESIVKDAVIKKEIVAAPLEEMKRKNKLSAELEISNYTPTNEEISAGVKKYKISRNAVTERLKNNHRAAVNKKYGV
jgi:hypothetical protein